VWRCPEPILTPPGSTHFPGPLAISRQGATSGIVTARFGQTERAHGIGCCRQENGRSASRTDLKEWWEQILAVGDRLVVVAAGKIYCFAGSNAPAALATKAQSWIAPVPLIFLSRRRHPEYRDGTQTRKDEKRWPICPRRWEVDALAAS